VQEPRGTRRVEDLNIQGTPEAWRESGRRLFKPQTALLRWRGLRRGGSKSGDSQTLGTGVVLGEPGFDLGERGRRDRFWGSTGRKSFLPRRSDWTLNNRQRTHFALTCPASAFNSVLGDRTKRRIKHARDSASSWTMSVVQGSQPDRTPQKR
jgi:hypothetical protein